MYSKIVIAGRRCAGKTTLLWSLQKELNWPVFSISQYLRDIIRSYGLSPEQVQEQSDKVTKDIDERVLALVKSSNNVIVEGRVFGMLLQPVPEVLRVLLVADDQKRIERSATREGISREKAEKRLFKKEDELIERMGKIYNCQDFFKPEFYEKVINTTNLTPEQVQEEVLQLIRK